MGADSGAAARQPSSIWSGAWKLGLALLAIAFGVAFGTLVLGTNGVELEESGFSYGRIVIVLMMAVPWIVTFAVVGGWDSELPRRPRLWVATASLALCAAIFMFCEFRGIALHQAWGDSQPDSGPHDPGAPWATLGLGIALAAPFLAAIGSGSLSRRLFSYSVGAMALWWLITAAAITAAYHS